jgi:DNA-binding transcriptional regulator YiaG
MTVPGKVTARLLRRALEWAGSAERLAQCLNVSEQQLAEWIEKEQPMPEAALDLLAQLIADRHQGRFSPASDK